MMKYILTALSFTACTEVSISKIYQPADTAFPDELITEADDAIVDTSERKK
mgnify:CR=1 FL=1